MIDECTAVSKESSEPLDESVFDSDLTNFGKGRRTSTPKFGSVVSLDSFDMSSSQSQLNLNLGTNLITSQPEPRNLAGASVAAATSLLYSSGLRPGLSSTGEKDKTTEEEVKQKSSSLSGRYTSTASSTTSVTTMSNGSSSHANGSSTTGVGYTNGSSLTGTGGYSTSSNAGNYRLASLDRLAQRQKLYDNGAGGDAVSVG